MAAIVVGPNSDGRSLLVLVQSASLGTRPGSPDLLASEASNIPIVAALPQWMLIEIMLDRPFWRARDAVRTDSCSPRSDSTQTD